jgi:hypothetical protein
MLKGVIRGKLRICLPGKLFRQLQGNPQIFYCVYKRVPLTHIRIQMNPVHTLTLIHEDPLVYYSARAPKSSQQYISLSFFTGFLSAF